MSTWKAYLAVGLGSGIGSALRYSVSLLSQTLLGGYFPWGTLIVNVIGSCLIGWLAASAARSPHSPWHPLLVAGFCGGFTTFSLFSLETLHLMQTEQAGIALLYVLVSLPLWLGAAILGKRWASTQHRAA